MLVFIVLCAILNICLGFAAAVYLKSGLNGFVDVWDSLVGSRSADERIHLPNSSMIETTGENQIQTPSTEQVNAAPVADVVNDATPIDSIDASLSEEWAIDEKFVETSILRLNFAMMKCNAKAVQIDTKLRECRGRSNSEIIELCTKLLLDDSVSYLAEQTVAAEKIHDRIGEFGDLSRFGRRNRNVKSRTIGSG